MSEAQAAWHQFVRRARRLPTRARVATHDLTWYRSNNETVHQTGEPPNLSLPAGLYRVWVGHGSEVEVFECTDDSATATTPGRQ